MKFLTKECTTQFQLNNTIYLISKPETIVHFHCLKYKTTILNLKLFIMKTITTKAGIFLVAIFAIFILTECDNTNTPNPAKPIITNITPNSGEISSVITIKGNNFSTRSSNNIVRFGSSKATVINATETTLKVSVPNDLEAGNSYEITVTVDNQTAASPTKFTVTSGNPMPGANLKPCSVRLYDGNNFSATEDSITVKGPGQFSSLANLPNSNHSWNSSADSYKSGTKAAVSFWQKTNFEGDSVSFNAGSQKDSLSIEPSSMKINCNK